jgi:hypothetical protein
MTTINLLTLFKEIISVYCENHTKSIHTFCGQNAKLLIVEVGGTHSYHWALKSFFLWLLHIKLKQQSSEKPF